MIRMDPDGPGKGKQFSVQNFLVLNTVTPMMTSVRTVLTMKEPVLIGNRQQTSYKAFTMLNIFSDTNGDDASKDSLDKDGIP